MKTTQLPQSAWNDEQAAGSQLQSAKQSTTPYLAYDKKQQTGCASNDDVYKSSSDKVVPSSLATHDLVTNAKVGTMEPNHPQAKATIDCSYKKDSGYKKAAIKVNNKVEKSSAILYQSEGQAQPTLNNIKKSNAKNNNVKSSNRLSSAPSNQIPERVFMNGLLKHTAIALAIIIPLAAFSAYAAPQNLPMNATPADTTATKTAANSMATLAVEPSSIIHNQSATVPTAVDSVDLDQYAGTWYEIGRLPMYFQRNCARDVTATYTGKADGSGIDVLNQCRKEDGSMMSANGLAKAVDSSGSKLKVTFLPSWIRWLPVGKADYWVLARDADYKTALVGMPNRKYLWLLARSPNISQQTYAKYRQIAQQQGYDLKEFKLTTQTNQNVTLVP
ncbi:lipocalin family protein [Psychrobacter urativorans]|uniref:Lipocalin/cytosolic fatty-acid binding domain-containing protein n=1 Tax=Psychrobacter urativorans TaxID=45610 RepID=A0A0M5MLB5_9GAMM|nr:lipocalin family protein [Psychrobacter urativorans]ALF60462.1 hypothetical protein AOC03_10775 [Psychrobacter urativorans]